MQGISTTISLVDRMTVPIVNISNSMANLVEHLNSVESAADIDAAAITKFAGELGDVAGIARAVQGALGDVQGAVPKSIPLGIEPVWQAPKGIEIFQNTGIERFEYEMVSLNDDMLEVVRNQERISAQAAGMKILPTNAVEDIAAVTQRINAVGQQIEDLQNIDVSMLDDNQLSQYSSKLETIRSTYTGMINAQERMNTAIGEGDFSALNSGFNQVNGLAEQLERQMRSTVAAVKDMSAVEIPKIEWNTPQRIEIFQNSGMDRYKQEIQSANNMMNSLASNQQRITEQAAGMDILPPQALRDMVGLNQRTAQLQQQLKNLEDNALSNLGADGASREVEQVRQQLSQAIEAQNQMNAAVERMDVSAANAAYTRLSGIVDGTTQNIRDNASAQEQFNDAISAGAQHANTLADRIGRMVATYATVQGVKNVLGLSDELTQTTARLDMMNDGLQTTQDLQNMLFLAAERSRGSYQSMADSVSKMGLMAGDAFGSNTELIAFTEQLNKQFVIAGASAQGIDAAMTQLTQAMGSGVLRGEELNSVFEQAPIIVQTIADYMGIGIGQIREMAQEGELTAEVVKNAMLAATDATNAAFESMPMTFGQIATSIQNNALMAFQPVLDRLNEFANSSAFTMMLEDIKAALPLVADLAMQVIDSFEAIGNALSENWGVIQLIGQVLYTVGHTVVAVFQQAASVVNWFMSMIGNSLTGVQENLGSLLPVVSAVTLALVGWKLATLALAAAKAVLNLHTIAIVALIGAIIFVVYKVVDALGEWQDKTMSVTGIIGGVFSTLFNFIYNTFVVPFQNAFADIVNLVGNAFKDPVAAVKVLFADMGMTILGWIQNAVHGIEDLVNKIGEVLGFQYDLTFELDALYDALDDKRNKLKAETEWVEYMEQWGYKDYGEAFNAGYEFGESLENKVKDLANDFSLNLGGNTDLGLDLGGGFDTTGITPYDQLVTNTGEIADNTKDSLEITDEEIKLWRDIAEREAINKFTLVDLKIDQHNENHIAGDMDIDGVAGRMVDDLQNWVLIQTEGVHA